MKVAWIRMTIAAALFAGLATGCAATGASHETDITLIRMKPNPNRISLTGGMEGVIEVRQGCTYLVSKHNGAAVLMIWPSSYELWRQDGRAIGLLNNTTGQTLKFGVNARFGGGDATHLPASELETPIPSNCNGPSYTAEFASP